MTRQPRFGFYAETCFYRTEHFLHDQYLGMTRANVSVLSRWGTNLDEFPVRSLYLAEEYRSPFPRVWNAVVRRLHRPGPKAGPGQLPPYVVGRLVRQLRRHPVELLYSFFGWNAAQLLDVLDALPWPVPLVFFAGGSDITGAASLGAEYLDRLRRLFERSALIVCGSRFLHDKLSRLGAPEHKIMVNYIGIALPEIEPVPAPGSGRRDELRILAVSRLSPVKGVLHTIRAFSRVARALPGATLRIVGDGEQRSECEDLVDQLRLRPAVQFTGSLPLAGVWTEMRSADVFVQHNVRTAQGQEEALGGSVIEASAHRLPVVVTRSGGVPEAVAEGATGLIVAPGDEEGMAEAILMLARDPGRRGQMGAAGRALVQHSFDIRRQNERLETLLLGVCGNPS